MLSDIKSDCNNELFIIYFQGLLDWVDVPNLFGMVTNEDKEPLDKLTNYRNTTWLLALPESQKYYLPPTAYLIPHEIPARYQGRQAILEPDKKKAKKLKTKAEREHFNLPAGTADGIDTEKLKKQINSIRISFQLNPETGRPDTYLNGINVEKKIRTMEVSSRVSPIAALDFVREAMVAQQQEMGKAKGIVMDGRDIGTTVFPDAELKIFVTASPEIRAQRRYDELKAKGEEAGFDEILENVKQRDYIDQNREVSPLRKADDALLLDNSHMTISQQKEWLAEQFEKVCKS